MQLQLTPQQETTIAEFLSDRLTRLNTIYWIVDKNGSLQRFSMNWAQTSLHNSAHTRNLVLKVRQLGISTYIALLILDSCLFTPNFQAAIVDRKFDDACAKIAKIAFAYDHLDYLPPDPSTRDIELAKIGRLIKDRFGTITSSGEIKDLTAKRNEIRFSNGSSVVASTSARGGTLQLLHVSELGYISVHDPIRAQEIVTGSFNSVSKDCRIFAESTHEGGKYGQNYDLIMSSMDNIGKPLSTLDFKFFFFPWYLHPEYSLPDSSAPISPEDNAYFNSIEKSSGSPISTAQRQWYIAMRKTQGMLMRQEYPSTPDEALNPIQDGTIYFAQLMDLRSRGHLSASFEPDPHRPIYTAWDLGIGDYMSIWWIQPDGAGHWYILDNYTASNQPISHYIDILRSHDALWSRCALCVCPHDVSRRDINLQSYSDALRSAGYSVTRVPATSNLWLSIDNTRQLLDTCIFHERCSERTSCDTRKYISGLDALGGYRLAPPGSHGNLAAQPLHDECSHAADALRTFADAVKLGFVGKDLAFQSHKLSPSEDARQRAYINSMLSI